jgi:hypothetical protein
MVVCVYHLATAVSLAQQFLYGVNTPQYHDSREGGARAASTLEVGISVVLLTNKLENMELIWPLMANFHTKI